MRSEKNVLFLEYSCGVFNAQYSKNAQMYEAGNRMPHCGVHPDITGILSDSSHCRAQPITGLLSNLDAHFPAPFGSLPICLSDFCECPERSHRCPLESEARYTASSRSRLGSTINTVAITHFGTWPAAFLRMLSHAVHLHVIAA